MNIHVHVHIHHEHDRSISERLDQIIAQGAQIIMQNEETLALIGRVDAATSAIGSDVTKIASEIADLKNQISTGMTSAEVSDLNSKLSASVTRLESAGASLDAIGKDPADPVPAPTPDAGTGDSGTGSGSPS